MPIATAMKSSDAAKSPPELADGIIVKYSDLRGRRPEVASTRIQAFARKTNLPIVYKRAMSDDAHVLSLDKIRPMNEVAAIASRLGKEKDVLYAEPNAIMWPDMTPNDSDYSLQWHYHEAIGGINVEQAWDKSTGENVIVAVIDTGYRPHFDLASNILPGYDFISDVSRANDGTGRDADARDPGDWVNTNECYSGSPAERSSWHGTHVAGTIAAVTNNGVGGAGVAWGARVVPVRVLGKCGGTIADISDGIRWAAGLNVIGVPTNANRAQVINMSLGGLGACGSTYQNAIDAARNAGTTVVVSAGNLNIDASNARPANCNGVISVAATNRNGAKAWYSNVGAIVDIAAPGGDTAINLNGVYSTLNNGTTIPATDSFEFYQGTSMAAPHVSGVAAMLYALNPTITPDNVENTLKSTAREFSGVCNQCGSGIVDASTATSSIVELPAFNLKWLMPVINLILF